MIDIKQGKIVFSFQQMDIAVNESEYLKFSSISVQLFSMQKFGISIENQTVVLAKRLLLSKQVKTLPSLLFAHVF